MSGVLFIGINEQIEIETAIARARAKPRPWAEFKHIADPAIINRLTLDQRRGPNVVALLRKYPSQFVTLGTYRAAISFEEQPAGMFRHLSVSSRDKGKLPGEEVMKMIMEAFGFSGLPLQRAGRWWLEEFDPGHMAVNIIEIEA